MLTRARFIYSGNTTVSASIIGCNAYPEGDVCMHLLDALLNSTVKEYITSISSNYDEINVNAMTTFLYKYDENDDTLSIYTDHKLQAVITKETALQWKLLLQNTNLIYHAAAKGLSDKEQLGIDIWKIDRNAISTKTVYDLIAFAEKICKA